MQELGKAMLIYAGDYDDKFPTPSKWCDLLIEHTDVPDCIFVCQGARGCKSGRCYSTAWGPQCTYAMNKNMEEISTGELPPDMVLLFETEPGWDQFGGPEILSTDNHQGDGCNILFVDCHVEFVMTKALDDLKWTPE